MVLFTRLCQEDLLMGAGGGSHEDLCPPGTECPALFHPGLSASPVGSWLRRETGLTGGAGRAFRAGEHTASHYSGGHTSSCMGHTHSKSSTKNGLRVNPGLRASMTRCGHDRPALVRDVGGTVGGVCGWVRVYGKLSVLSTQFCCEQKNSLKNKVCFIKKSKQKKRQYVILVYQPILVKQRRFKNYYKT